VSDKFGDVLETLPTKQSFRDRPGVLEDKALVEATLSSAHYWASFLPLFKYAPLSTVEIGCSPSLLPHVA